MHNSTKRSETKMKPTEVFNSFKAYNHLNFTINHPFLMRLSSNATQLLYIKKGTLISNTFFIIL